MTLTCRGGSSMATRENRLCRRELLKATAATVAAGFSGVAGGMFQNSVAGEAEISASEEVKRLARRLPRWRGFNLMEKISADSIMRAHADPLPGNQPFREQDFEWIAELGFDFVRLPMDYHCWADPEDPYRLLEKTLREIDQAVDWGRQYGIHVSLNMHHAPGPPFSKVRGSRFQAGRLPQRQRGGHRLPG